jgi:hypothetical protein
MQKMLLQPVKPESFYDASKDEAGVLVTGPFSATVGSGENAELTAFVNNRRENLFVQRKKRWFSS